VRANSNENKCNILSNTKASPIKYVRTKVLAVRIELIGNLV
jgi:hypothetical protein